MRLEQSSDRAAAEARGLLDLAAERSQQRLGARRLHREALAVGGLRERLGTSCSMRRVERDRGQVSLLVEVAGRDRAGERLARRLDEGAGSRVVAARSPIASRIVPRSRIGDALAQQLLQHALHLAEPELVRHDVLDGGRVPLLERVEQPASSPRA